MIKQMLSSTLLLCSIGLAEEPFIADTTLEFPEISIPVVTVVGESDTTYIDSLCRRLLWKSEVRGFNNEFHEINSFAATVDKNNNISFLESYSKSLTNYNFVETFSTVKAENWNERGMISKGLLDYTQLHVRKINSDTTVTTMKSTNFYAYDSIGTTLIDTFSLDTFSTDLRDMFIPDTLVVSGQCAIPVHKYAYAGIGEPWIELEDDNIDVSFADSLGRVVGKHYRVFYTGSGSARRFDMTFDWRGNVMQQTNIRHGHGGGKYGGFSTVRDTLVGESWNSLGMIKEGVVKKATSSNIKDSIYAPQRIEVVYENDGFTPLDTILLNETSLLASSETLRKGISVNNKGAHLQIEGVVKNSSLSLYSVTGRLLYSAHSLDGGAVQIPTDGIAKGVLFLKINSHTMKIKL